MVCELTVYCKQRGWGQGAIVALELLALGGYRSYSIDNCGLSRSHEMKKQSREPATRPGKKMTSVNGGSWEGSLPKIMMMAKTGSSQTLLFQIWSFAILTQALFWALLRPFALLRLRAFALICALLLSVLIAFRTTAFENIRRKRVSQPLCGNHKLEKVQGATRLGATGLRASESCCPYSVAP